jgi:hypothetical protein
MRSQEGLRVFTCIDLPELDESSEFPREPIFFDHERFERLNAERPPGTEESVIRDACWIRPAEVIDGNGRPEPRALSEKQLAEIGYRIVGPEKAYGHRAMIESYLDEHEPVEVIGPRFGFSAAGARNILAQYAPAWKLARREQARILVQLFGLKQKDAAAVTGLGAKSLRAALKRKPWNPARMGPVTIRIPIGGSCLPTLSLAPEPPQSACLTIGTNRRIDSEKGQKAMAV